MMTVPTSNDITQWTAELTHGDATVRAKAAQGLSRYPAEAQPAAVALVQAAGDADEGVREWVVAALEELGAPAVEQCGELAALVGHAEPDVAYWAATLLGRLGEAAAPAVERLTMVLEQSNAANVRERIVWALGQIGPQAAAAVPTLKQLSSSDNPRLARMATKAIQLIEQL